MPRKRSYIRRGGVEENMALGALADQTAIAEIFDNVVDGKTFLVSIHAAYALRAHTAGEGPIVFGVAHSDYSSAEIEEYLETTGSWKTGDKIAQEQARRKVRIIGVFDGLSTEEKFKDGELQKTPLKFMIEEAQSLKLWAYNKSGAALTTGTVLTADGSVWLKPA